MSMTLQGRASTIRLTSVTLSRQQFSHEQSNRYRVFNATLKVSINWRARMWCRCREWWTGRSSRRLYRAALSSIMSVNAEGEVTSQDLWSRHDRHLVGVKCSNEWRWAAKMCRCVYSDKIQPGHLRKCPYDHRLTSKAYISAVTVTNKSTSFYQQNGGKKSAGIDIEQNYVIVTLCNT